MFLDPEFCSVWTNFVYGDEVKVDDEGALLTAVSAGDACIDEEDGVVASGDEAVEMRGVAHYELVYGERLCCFLGVGASVREAVGCVAAVP